MKKLELIYREMLYQVMELNNRRLTQSHLSKELQVSLSTVNHSLKPLRKMGAVDVRRQLFVIVEPKKLLYHWASIRNLEKDLVCSVRVEMPVAEIEKNIPDNAIFSAYTAYKFKFEDVPADYSEVYVYGEKMENRFKAAKGTPNLFILKKDKFLVKYGKITTMANTFVDLWNLKKWYAHEFVKALEERMHGILE